MAHRTTRVNRKVNDMMMSGQFVATSTDNRGRKTIITDPNEYAALTGMMIDPKTGFFVQAEGAPLSEEERKEERGKYRAGLTALLSHPEVRDLVRNS